MRDARLDLSGGLWRWAVVIGVGIFGTTLAQSVTLDLPFRNLLTSRFGAIHPDPCGEASGTLHSIAQFFAIVSIPWYFKFVVGIVSDSIPLFGTMRRHYVILSALAAAALWFLAGQIQHSYLSLLVVITLMETMLVVCSTVVGALLVEIGQRLDAAGRLVSARISVEGACVIAAGPLAGILGGESFGIAATVAALIVFTIVPVSVAWLKEPATARYQVSAVADVKGELRRILRSRVLWLAAAFIFLASMPQLFPTPLWNFQKCDMNPKLSDAMIGYLRAAGGAGTMVAALIYAAICRRFSLKSLIALGILASSLGSFSYMFYHSVRAAFAIELANGFLSSFWVLAMMEMSVRVAPKSAEAAAFALLMGAYNLGTAVGDYIFSDLMDWSVFGFSGVAAVSGALTVLTIVLLRFFPDDMF
jgi:predicted MFS family arabinose efflux permease